MLAAPGAAMRSSTVPNVHQQDFKKHADAKTTRMERHSATGRPINETMKRQGSGKGNWGR